MVFSPQAVLLKHLPLLKQPKGSKLIREPRRSLTELTEEQLAEIVGVSYGTINRWENGHMQPSPLALKQVRAMLEQVIHSASPPLQHQGQHFAKPIFL